MYPGNAHMQVTSSDSVRNFNAKRKARNLLASVMPALNPDSKARL